MIEKTISCFLFSLLLVSFLFTAGVEANETLTLDQAVETALENSERLEQARERYQQRKDELKLYRRKYTRQFDFNLGSDQEFQYREVEKGEGLSEDGYIFDSNTNLTITHDLSPVNRVSLSQKVLNYTYNEVFDDDTFDGLDRGSLRYEHEFWTNFDKRLDYKLELMVKEIAVFKQEKEIKEIEEELEYEVIDSYYNLLELKEREEINGESLAQAKQTLEIVRSRFEAGEVLELDKEEAELKVEERKLALERIEADYKLALLELADILGEEIPQGANLAEEEKIPFDIQKEEVKQKVLENNRELKLVEKEIKRQKQEINYLAKSSDFSLEGVSEVGWSDEEFGDEYQVGLYFNYNFNTFTSEKEDNQLTKEELTLAEFEDNKSKIEEELSLKVNKKYQELNNYRQEIEFSRREIVNAKKALEIAKERYQQGTTTLSDLLEAQIELREKERGYVENLLDYNRQVYQLKQLIEG